MNKFEFINAVNDLEGEKIEDVSDKDFGIINTVYTFHPAINYESSEAKKQVATLYRILGMSVFYDMLETAEEAKDHMERIANYRQMFEDSKERYDDFLRKVGCSRER